MLQCAQNRYRSPACQVKWPPKSARTSNWIRIWKTDGLSTSAATAADNLANCPRPNSIVCPGWRADSAVLYEHISTWTDHYSRNELGLRVGYFINLNQSSFQRLNWSAPSIFNSRAINTRHGLGLVVGRGVDYRLKRVARGNGLYHWPREIVLWTSWAKNRFST